SVLALELYAVDLAQRLPTFAPGRAECDQPLFVYSIGQRERGQSDARPWVARLRTRAVWCWNQHLIQVGREPASDRPTHCEQRRWAVGEPSRWAVLDTPHSPGTSLGLNGDVGTDQQHFQVVCA